MNRGLAPRVFSGQASLSLARWDPLAACGLCRTITLWDVATGKEQATLTGHTGRVYSVSFSPDGKMLVSGSADGTIKVWDVQPAK